MEVTLNSLWDMMINQFFADFFFSVEIIIILFHF